MNSKRLFAGSYWENKGGLLNDVQKQEITGGPICLRKSFLIALILAALSIASRLKVI